MPRTSCSSAKRSEEAAPGDVSDPLFSKEQVDPGTIYNFGDWAGKRIPPDRGLDSPTRLVEALSIALNWWTKARFPSADKAQVTKVPDWIYKAGTDNPRKVRSQWPSATAAKRPFSGPPNPRLELRLGKT